MKKANLAGKWFILFLAVVLCGLLLGAYVYSSVTREKNEIVLEAERMTRLGGAAGNDHLRFFQNGLVSKDVIIPESWIGKNIKVSILSKSDPFPFKPIVEKNLSYNVTFILPDNLSISDVLGSEKEGELINVSVSTSQNDGIRKQYLYEPVMNYSELKEYLIEKYYLSLRLKNGEEVKVPAQKDTELILTNVVFANNSVTSHYYTSLRVNSTYPHVFVLVNGVFVGSVIVESDTWKINQLAQPFVASSTQFTLELEYLDDVSANITLENGSSQHYNKNLYLKKVILSVE